MDAERWTDHRTLDLDMKPEGFVAWRDRALVTWQPDIRKLLLWAESQNLTIGTTEEKKGATNAGEDGDICHISSINFESLKMIMSGSLLSRARGRSWSGGSALQVIAAKARKFQSPQR